MMKSITIDGKKIDVEEGKTVLEAALEAGIYIPNLCYHPDLSPTGACRLCIVEIEGWSGYPTACTTKVEDGMVIHTETEKLKRLRENIIWLILSEYPFELEDNTQLSAVAKWIGIKDMLSDFKPVHKDFPVITDEPLYIRDLNKCVLCRRCVRICHDVRGVGVIGFVNRGIETIVGTPYNLPMMDADCKFCRACVEVCPSGALVDKLEYDEKTKAEVLVPCKYACPAQIDIPRYVKLIAQKRYQDALEVIRERVPLPHILGCVCNHPCEEACSRGEVNKPIAIRALKRFVAERDNGRWRSKVKVAPDTGKRVAVVGSGPAGLTTAWYLRILGHSVTIFEAMSEPGGTMRTGIPEYRLPREVLDREIEEILSIGVELKTNTIVESTDDLFNDGYDAIFLALGAMEGMKMGIEGEDDERVLDALTVLKDVSLRGKADVEGDVVVVGGGNSAIDVARTALRVGAKKVTIMYRRTRQEMPALEEEIEEAINEGVEIAYLTCPERVIRGDGKLKVECIRMELGEPDASGRRRPVPIDGSQFTVEVDRLIMAIGQRPKVPEKLGLPLTRWNTIKVDEETLATPREGVFAGGDVVSGPATVIEAIRDGRRAAISIDKYLGGEGNIDVMFIPEDEEIACLGRDEGFAYWERVEMPSLPVNDRLKGFSEVELGYSEEQAEVEALRCLTCHIRLNISRAPMPPETRK